MRDERLKELEKALGISIDNPELFITALTHPSGLTTGSSEPERLEFLGDAVLQLAVSTILFMDFPDHDEGDLTKLRAELVNRFTLYEIAMELGLDKLVILGKSEEETGGRKKISILSDTLERVIGALFLEKGFPTSLSVIKRIFGDRWEKVTLTDWKSMLQEISQRIYGKIPKYTVISEDGLPHKKTYKVSVEIGGESYYGEGSSKKMAEKNAAFEALKNIRRWECQE